MTSYAELIFNGHVGLDALRAMRDALLNARAQGVRNTTYRANGVERAIEWRSDVELRQALADVSQKLAEAEGKPAVAVINITSQKGFL